MMLLAQAKKMWAKIVYWRKISISRAELANLSDIRLKDIGMSRAEAEFEARRPFWDTKPHEDVPCGQNLKKTALKLHYN